MSTDFSRTITSNTLNIDLNKQLDNAESFSTLCTDIFLIVIRMREHADLGTPESLRRLLLHYINLFEQNCGAMKIDSSLVDTVKHALVALIDETVLSIPGPCAEFWLTKPLQFELYGTMNAGERFFSDLDILLKNIDAYAEAIEVFYLCLTLGFEGKYMDESQKREQIINDVARVLVKASKQKERIIPIPVEKKGKPVRSAKIIPIWLIGVVSSLILICIWLVGYISVNTHEKKTIKIISEISSPRGEAR
jgi:type IV/VI secretion system ImpK/VasF family protein